jgi:hypothetical protein
MRLTGGNCFTYCVPPGARNLCANVPCGYFCRQKKDPDQVLFPVLRKDYGTLTTEAKPYLKLPKGKKLAHNGTELALADLLH